MQILRIKVPRQIFVFGTHPSSASLNSVFPGLTRSKDYDDDDDDDDDDNC